MRSIPDLLARRAASLAVTEAVDLPFAAAAQVTRPSPEWLRLARLARALAWASLGWLAIEGTVGVVAGVVAGSIALVGFGLDSAIEGLASVIVVWRFTGAGTLSAHSEPPAQKLVAVSFFPLAPNVAVESLRALIVAHHAETSIVGIEGDVLVPKPGLAPDDFSTQRGGRVRRL